MLWVRTMGLFVHLAACRFHFDAVEERGDGGDLDAPDAAVAMCGTPGADWADWVMPNDPISGRPNIASYTVQPNVVVDDRTRLVWQRAPSQGMFDLAGARAYCASLTLDGACWRLPHRVELVSIVNYSIANPSIDTAAFPATPNVQFWSATVATSSPTEAWTVNFSAGHTDFVPMTEQHAVRCVQVTPEPAANRYTTTTDTVMDLKTGLEWQRVVDPNGYTFSAAETYCTSLALAGGGWRQPSIQELQTIVDTSRTSVLVDPDAFPNTPPQIFWSGSPLATDVNMGWSLDFSVGYAFRPIGSQLRVRCVR